MKCFSSRPFARLALVLAYCSSIAGCGAVYPEVATPVRSVPQGREVSPEPPPNLLYIVLEKAIIPRQTRDGRKWDAVGGAAPDPFAKVLVNGEEIIKTPIENNTLHPTWPDQVRANYQVEHGARVQLELWDSNPIHNDPICRKSIEFIHEKVGTGANEVLCDSGARILLRVDKARPQLGLGLFYELGSQKAAVTRVIRHSPAARAGLAKGTEIVSIQSQAVKQLDADQIRSLINANAPTGIQLSVKLPDGVQKQVEFKEGAIYPLVSEGVTFQQ